MEPVWLHMKDGFEYWEGYDEIEFNEIESLPSPWQRYFLNRVKSKMEEKELSQTRLCQESESVICKSTILDTSYRLHESTLSQYTNIHSNNLRVAPVDCVIALSETLGVSVDYLLGIDTAETREKTDVLNATGLNSAAVDILASNTKIQKFLNYALTSPLFSSVYKQIKNITYSDSFVHDFLTAYSNNLREKLEEVFNDYNNISFAFSRNEDSFKDLLISKLPLENLSPLNDYLKKNLSEDRYWQICYQAGNEPSEQTLYDTFIEDTVMCIFDIANYKGNEDYYSNELSHAFVSLVKDFSKKRNGTD